MKKQDVPQDHDMNDGVKEIAYAVDRDGRYVKVQSLGWEAKNAANAQAWEQIEAGVAEVIQKIASGARSPLAYHMAVNLMDTGLLASYAGISRWRVGRHLKPGGFDKMKPEMRRRYADIFGISTEQLGLVPESDFKSGFDSELKSEHKSGYEPNREKRR